MIRTSTRIYRSTNVFTGKLEFESRSKIQKYDLTVNQVEHLSYIYRCTKKEFKFSAYLSKLGDEIDDTEFPTLFKSKHSKI